MKNRNIDQNKTHTKRTHTHTHTHKKKKKKHYQIIFEKKLNSTEMYMYMA